LLTLLNEAEAAFGRVRQTRNEARVLDLDIVDYGGQIINTDRLTCPHPRATERAFVLLPLAEIAPDWVHPATGENIARLIDRLPAGQQISRLPGNGWA
jgi:2-amino-4-hydroxy-6-hydroxymethyldihydropteridine diphosphokinase